MKKERETERGRMCYDKVLARMWREKGRQRILRKYGCQKKGLGQKINRESV